MVDCVGDALGFTPLAFGRSELMPTSDFCKEVGRSMAMPSRLSIVGVKPETFDLLSLLSLDMSPTFTSWV